MNQPEVRQLNNTYRTTKASHLQFKDSNDQGNEKVSLKKDRGM